MSERKEYSVDDILNEAKQRASAREKSDISTKAQQQADALLAQLRTADSANSAQVDFDDFFANLSARTKGREQREQAAAAMETQEEVAAPVREPKTVQVTPVLRETEITVAPTDMNVPQSKKRLKSIDEVMNEVAPDSEESIIDKAVANQKEEKRSTRERQLTRTGVIRKANALIDKSIDDGAEKFVRSTAGRMGTLHQKEKIVGEKDDVQALAYREYIRRKEKKKQDTGIIKTIDIKIAEKAEEKTKVIPAVRPLKSADELEMEKTKVQAPLVDEPTKIEQTIIGAKKQRVISDIRHTGNIEGQTRLEGFFDDEEVEKITEDELEEQLEHNRREKIDRFELEEQFKQQSSEAIEAAPLSNIDETYAPEKETPVIHDIIDYNSKNDQRAVYLELEQLQNRFKMRTAFTFGAELIVLLVGIFGSGILPDFGLGTGNEKVYIIINFIALVALLIFNMRAIFKGLKALLMLKPSGDSLAALAATVTAVHCVLSFLLGESGAGVTHLYVGAVGFIFLLNCFGKRSMIRRIFKNFRFIIKSGEKYSSAPVTKPKEIKEFSKGSQEGYYDIRYNVKTTFPTRFLANSFADDPADTVAKVSVYPVIGFSVIIALITYFITKDVLGAVSALTALLLIGVPASGGMAFHKALENADSALLKERGTITGFAACDDAAGATAVVLGSDEIFPENCCRLKGMKLFKKMQMDEAILYAAGALDGTRHPLKAVFMESVSEVKDKMPASFDTAYESKLGISTWIYERKVLLGTKEMMGAHGIEIPAAANPEEYNEGNVRTMFLAIDGAVYAMFVCEYFSDPVIEYELQRLEASGIEILIKTEDANVNETLVSEIFDLDAATVKVLSSVASGMYDEKISRSVYNEAKIINRGDPITFIRSITACSILSGQFKLLKTLQYVGIVLGLALVAVLSLMSSVATIGPVHLVAYAAFWMIVTNVIPRIYKAVPKR